jgi:hypothetical protein
MDTAFASPKNWGSESTAASDVRNAPENVACERFPPHLNGFFRSLEQGTNFRLAAAPSNEFFHHSILKFRMKRDRDNLLRERADGEEDSRRRRSARDVDVAARRQWRVARANEALATNLSQNIDHWKEENILCVSDWTVEEPVLASVGPEFPVPKLLNDHAFPLII